MVYTARIFVQFIGDNEISPKEKQKCRAFSIVKLVARVLEASGQCPVASIRSLEGKASRQLFEQLPANRVLVTCARNMNVESRRKNTTYCT